MKRAYLPILEVLVVLIAFVLISRLAYLRGYRTRLNHQKAQLVLTVDTLDQLHAGNVDAAMRLAEESCFRLANEFLTDESYQSDPDIRALMPRLVTYWDTYCAGRAKHTPMEERFGSLLPQR